MLVEGYNSPPLPSKQSPHPLKVLENTHRMAASTLKEIERAGQLSQQFAAQVKQLLNLVKAGKLPDRRLDGQITSNPTGFGIERWPDPVSSNGRDVVTLPYEISNSYRYRLLDKLGICDLELEQGTKNPDHKISSTSIPGIIVLMRRHQDLMLIGWEFKSVGELTESLAQYR